MIEFKYNTPTIAQVYEYTYMNKQTKSRFENEKRDILVTKIKVEKRIVYKKNKEGKFTTPDERLLIHSESCPQYYPYQKVKSKRAMKQRKIHHEYDVTMILQKSTITNDYNYWESKIIWRVGSLKKWPKSVPQNKVKTIFKETRNRLEKKYSKLPQKEKEKKIKKEVDKIRERAKYLNVGDYVAQELGINGDFYYRCSPIMERLDCLYGRNWIDIMPKGISYAFFDKHSLAVINFLLKRGIIKY